MDLIVIPSAGRAHKQVTLAALRKAQVLDDYLTVLCVPDREYKDYRHIKDAEIIGVPDKIKDITATRAWILNDLTKYLETRYVLMLDDDMDFCYRPNVLDPKLEMVTSRKRMRRMINQLDGWMRQDKFVHVGLSARQGNNRPFAGVDGTYGLHQYRDVARMNNAYAFDTKVLHRLTRQGKLEVGRVLVMEDFDLTLQLLMLGYPNRVSFEYCWNQRGSGAKGGCSQYRDNEMQARAAHKLKKLYPDFVNIRTKKSKETSSSWKGMKERVDVTIQWRKAYSGELPT